MKFSTAIAASILAGSAFAESTFEPAMSGYHPFNLTAAKASAKRKFTFYDEENPYNRYYFSNNKLIGDRLGKTNDTDAVKTNHAEHMALVQSGVTPEVTGLDLIGYTAFAVFAGAALCIVIPNCPAYIVTNLRPVTNVAIEIITAFKGSKRDGNQYENWACEYENGYDGTCTNGNVVNPVVTQIGQTDMDDSYEESYWKSVSDDGATEFGHYWHCTQENSDCSLGDMGGPTDVDDEGSGEGH